MKTDFVQKGKLESMPHAHARINISTYICLKIKMKI